MRNSYLSPTVIRCLSDWLGSDLRLAIVSVAVISAAFWLGLQGQDVLQAIEEEKAGSVVTDGADLRSGATA